jgi:hypothetical protein
MCVWVGVWGKGGNQGDGRTLMERSEGQGAAGPGGGGGWRSVYCVYVCVGGGVEERLWRLCVWGFDDACGSLCLQRPCILILLCY